MKKMKFRLWLWLSLASVSFLGCGRSDQVPLGKVSGRVTYKGQPLPGAVVTFRPDTKGDLAGGGITDENGRYAVTTYNAGDGATVGSHRITIMKRELVKTTPSPQGLGAAFLEEAETRQAELAKPLIPLKYFQTNTSNLRFDVKSGHNKFDISLSD